ncbi:2-keto-4-pentenoate hydratase [Streptomyces longwoodensis]|uniref:2-keto-4-pentenoate hydratase n=1 Tax=Streptomyces longwoodensis TaxID=68231 RepID=UPI0036F7266A
MNEFSSGDDAVTRAADRLLRVAADRVPCPPVRAVIGTDDVKAAHAVQELPAPRRLAAGGRVTGRRIGFTSPAVQRQPDVEQPDVGVLFADTGVEDGASVPVDEMLQPKVDRGDGTAGPGDPPAALAWLARTARDVGDPLRADTVVLSGALGPMVPAAGGDVFRADITGLGSVPVRFHTSGGEGVPA